MFGSAIAVPEIDIATSATPVSTTGNVSRDGPADAESGTVSTEALVVVESMELSSRIRGDLPPTRPLQRLNRG
ncbi:hypothetical protein GCM10027298_15710 [Epidermidibacterium keratini]